MNLLLTSTGFSNRQVYAWAEREIGKRKAHSAAVIVSAHRERAERRFTKLTHAQLGAMGVTRPFFFDFESVPISMLADVPVIYMCGGNTFQLMAVMYKHNMKDVLDKFFDRGGLYIGESAGSCVMGSAIHHLADVRVDPDTVRFGNKPALNYVPKLILPHFYSDSHNDLPLLGQVSYPVAVDPDATLAEHAQERGWAIISLRGE